MKRKFRLYKNRVNQVNSLNKRCPICNSRLKKRKLNQKINGFMRDRTRYYCSTYFDKNDYCLFECLFGVDKYKETTNLISMDIFNSKDEENSLGFYYNTLYIALNNRNVYETKLHVEEISIRTIVNIYNKYIKNSMLM